MVSASHPFHRPLPGLLILSLTGRPASIIYYESSLSAAIGDAARQSECTPQEARHGTSQTQGREFYGAGARRDGGPLGAWRRDRRGGPGAAERPPCLHDGTHGAAHAGREGSRGSRG